MLAAERGHVDVAQLLLEAGADKDLQDCKGNSALTLAAKNGHVEIERLLVDAGVGRDLQRQLQIQ